MISAFLRSVLHVRLAGRSGAIRSLIVLNQPGCYRSARSDFGYSVHLQFCAHGTTRLWKEKKKTRAVVGGDSQSECGDDLELEPKPISTKGALPSDPSGRGFLST